jgi:hypothetical protein
MSRLCSITWGTEKQIRKGIFYFSESSDNTSDINEIKSQLDNIDRDVRDIDVGNVHVSVTTE